MFADERYWGVGNDTSAHFVNADHKLCAEISSDRVRVGELRDEQCEPSFSMTLTAWGRGGSGTRVADARPEFDRNWAFLHRADFLEWYSNTKEGLEQGFTFLQRPAGEGAVELRVHIDGASAHTESDASALSIRTRYGREMDYGRLFAIDSVGASLPIELALDGSSTIRIRVDDTGAKYPIFVDPTLGGTPGLQGDLDDNDIVSVADAPLLFQMLQDQIADEIDADVAPLGSPDDTVNAADAILLLRVLRGEDVDGDGLFLAEENSLGTSSFSSDSDGDGIDDDEELVHGTDPANSDTDDDGLSDWHELFSFLDGATPRYSATNPDSDGNGTNDGDEDFDGDTIPNAIEVALGLNAIDNDDGADDYDGDGLTNATEVAFGTGLDSDDTDADGLSDYAEVVVLVDSMGQPLFEGFSSDTNLNGVSDGAEDLDGDGLTNAQEAQIGFSLTHPLLYDTDNDSQMDGNEDSDGDGLSNLGEFQCSPNASDPTNPDTDGDGLNDYHECVVLLDGGAPIYTATAADTDGDGTIDSVENWDGDLLNNLEELTIGSDPLVANSGDQDSDGFNDYDELQAGYNPNLHRDLEDLDMDGLTYPQENLIPGYSDSDAYSNGGANNDGNADADGDGLTNALEFQIGTSPTDLDGDHDNDGLPDLWEYLNGTEPTVVDAGDDPDDDNFTNLNEMLSATNPLLDDSDFDGLLDPEDDSDNDGATNAEEILAGTNPLNAHSDGDPYPDGDEIYLGSNPLDDNDPSPTDDGDFDGMPDWWEAEHRLDLAAMDNLDDPDGDGISNEDEYCSGGTGVCEHQTNPRMADTDGDGVFDLQEITLGTSPLAPDALSSRDQTNLDDDDYLAWQEQLIPGGDDTNENLPVIKRAPLPITCTPSSSNFVAQVKTYEAPPLGSCTGNMVGVAPNTTLHLPPGVEIEFANGTGLSVPALAGLSIEGTSVDQVLLRGPGGVNWEGIIFTKEQFDSPGTLRIQHTEIRDALTGVELNVANPGSRMSQNDATIENTVITGLQSNSMPDYFGVHLTRDANASIRNVEIGDVYQGIRVEQTSAYISGLSIGAGMQGCDPSDPTQRVIGRSEISESNDMPAGVFATNSLGLAGARLTISTADAPTEIRCVYGQNARGVFADRLKHVRLGDVGEIDGLSISEIHGGKRVPNQGVDAIDGVDPVGIDIVGIGHSFGERTEIRGVDINGIRGWNARGVSLDGLEMATADTLTIQDVRWWGGVPAFTSGAAGRNVGLVVDTIGSLAGNDVKVVGIGDVPDEDAGNNHAVLIGGFDGGAPESGTIQFTGTFDEVGAHKCEFASVSGDGSEENEGISIIQSNSPVIVSIENCKIRNVEGSGIRITELEGGELHLFDTVIEDIELGTDGSIGVFYDGESTVTGKVDIKGGSFEGMAVGVALGDPSTQGTSMIDLRIDGTRFPLRRNYPGNPNSGTVIGIYADARTTGGWIGPNCQEDEETDTLTSGYCFRNLQIGVDENGACHSWEDAGPPNRTGMRLWNAAGALIEGSEFCGVNFGLVLYENADGMQIGGGPTIPDDLPRWNIFHDNEYGIYYGNSAGASSGPTVSGNWFYDNTQTSLHVVQTDTVSSFQSLDATGNYWGVDTLPAIEETISITSNNPNGALLVDIQNYVTGDLFDPQTVNTRVYLGVMRPPWSQQPQPYQEFELCSGCGGLQLDFEVLYASAADPLHVSFRICHEPDFVEDSENGNSCAGGWVATFDAANSPFTSIGVNSDTQWDGTDDIGNYVAAGPYVLETTAVYGGASPNYGGHPSGPKSVVFSGEPANGTAIAYPVYAAQTAIHQSNIFEGEYLNVQMRICDSNWDSETDCLFGNLIPPNDSTGWAWVRVYVVPEYGFPPPQGTCENCVPGIGSDLFAHDRRFVIVPTSTLPPGQSTLTWDGRLPSDPSYFLDTSFAGTSAAASLAGLPLTAIPMNDGTTRWFTGRVRFVFDSLRFIRERSIVVTRTSPQISTGTDCEGYSDEAIHIASTPYLIHDTYEQSAEIDFYVCQNASVRVSLIRPGGQDHLVQSAIGGPLYEDLEAWLIGDQNSWISVNQAQEITAEWNGYDSTHHFMLTADDEGPYTFLIEARNDQTGVVSTHRGILSVFH